MNRTSGDLVSLLLTLVFVLGLAAPALGWGPKQPISEPPATVGRSEGPRRPGGPVYPAQTIRVRMDHARHLAKGMSCRQCHARIDHSRLSSQNDLPLGEACDACHGDQHPSAPDGETRECSLCHTHVEEQRVTATTIFPRPNLHFSHEAHLARGTDCATCHGDFNQVGFDHRADVVRQRLAHDAELGCRPLRQELVPPGLGAKLKVLIQGEFLLKALLAFVKSGHSVSPAERVAAGRAAGAERLHPRPS
jgi:hypothetical protein